MINLKKCVVSFLSIIILLGGCGPQKPKENKIVIWHWLNDRKEALNKLAADYKTKTGVEVEFKLFSPADIYSQKVIAAARAGNLPDIFGILGEKRTLGSFIKAGHILNLTPYMQANQAEWKQRFYPKTIEVVTFKSDNSFKVPEGIYGAPIDTTIINFVYNKSLFKEAGLNPENPPKTFNEFIDFAKTIKTKKNVNGFVCGWGEGWLLDCLATEWAINLMGEDKFFKTIKGEVPYTDKNWIEVFSYFAKMRDSGVLAPNITTTINKESEDSFSKGNAAFSFNGSWAVNVYKQLGGDLDYGFFPLPKISQNFPAKVWGGAGTSFMVNAHSANREEAVKFLNWITEKQQQDFLVKETNNLPAIKTSEEALSPILKTLLGSLTILTHPNTWPYNEDSRVIEVMDKGLQQIVMGLKTPEEVAKDIQEVKNRVMSK
ncbi:MAG: extracellular solute-binding protein [Candidatus Omnitrophica bacterium]|jgi:ABC-type glycerol-3-phosphate transport system substrate-binding protein|nr:extracellular solute-binding protein [Candidatus Omnitrophota bacterium]